MKLGRNDPCPCGSGKKYKNCCLNSTKTPNEIWQDNFLALTPNIKNQIKVKDIFYSTYLFMKENDWKGACHILSTIQYILLCEIGLSPTICIGVVNTPNGRFDHSWIEINNDIYDIAIDNPLELNYSNCVIANHDIFTSKIIPFKYGTGESLDFEADMIAHSSISSYLDNFSHIPISQRPAPLKNGLWAIIIDLGKNIGLNLNLKELQNKYSHIYRVVK